MATAEELQAYRKSLEEARGSGEKRVTWNNRTVEFRDISEINEAIDRIDGEIEDLAKSGSTTPRYVFRYVGFRRG